MIVDVGVAELVGAVKVAHVGWLSWIRSGQFDGRVLRIESAVGPCGSTTTPSRPTVKSPIGIDQFCAHTPWPPRGRPDY